MLWAFVKAVMKSYLPVPCEINELVKNYKIAPANLLAERAAGCCCQYMRAALLCQRIDICPVVYLCWRNLVLSAMARKNAYINAGDFTDCQGRGWLSIRRLYFNLS